MTEARRLLPDLFQVSTGSSEPIYRQLVEQVRRLSVGGQVQAGDEMPSVREVSSRLGVNPMTVSKAYSLLEAQGVLERRRGMGMVLAAQTAQATSPDTRLNLLRPSLERIALEAQQLELEADQVLALLEALLKGNQP